LIFMKRIIRNTLYRILSLLGVWHLKRFLNRNNVAILMYHGVIEGYSDYWTQLNVRKFENQMQFLRNNYTPVTLKMALEILSGKTKGIRCPVVVTFDDGFLNNMTVADPILMKYNIPATIFLTVSLIDKKSKYSGLLWPDYVLALLLGTNKNAIDLTSVGFGKYDLIDNKDKYYAKEEICRKLKRIDANEKQSIIELIREKSGGNVDPGVRETFAGLDWSQVLELFAGGIVNFGAHTINHEILSRLSETEMNREIKESKEIIERETGIPVRHFAYPNGTRDDFNDTVKGIVAQYYDCALTTIEGLNESGDDLYELKRVNIGNDMDTLRFKMSLIGL
jgi:peptidoglycan/xylan/chitin deacetylase (PgdA/CDA1 family)